MCRKLTYLVSSVLLLSIANSAAQAELTPSLEEGGHSVRLDLTAEGTADWAYWWEDSLAKANEKASADDIGELAAIGNLDIDYSQWRTRRDVEFTDGTDPISGSIDDVGNRIRISSDPTVDEGYELVVAAGSETRVLKLYIRNRETAAKVVATLGDETSEVDVDPAGEDTDYVYTLEFSHPTATDLYVRYFCPAGTTTHHSIRMGAATLSGELVRVWKTAHEPRPASKAMLDIREAASLNWSAGTTAASHDVYFGTDEDSVADANTSSPEYKARHPATTYPLAGLIEFGGGTYYWRIDEVEADLATIHEGYTWSFTMNDYLTVDDFEDYNDYPPNRVFDTWDDGWDTAANGAQVGYDTFPFAEQMIVHGGRQSMPLSYNNIGSATYSEAERLWENPQDWTLYDVKALTLYFRGHPASVGSFSYDSGTGIYTITADGSDIWYAHDEFHYAYKRLSQLGSIEARVLSVTDTDQWVKGGLMIRETLDANSPFAAVYITPGMGCRFQARFIKGDNAGSDTTDPTDVATDEEKAIKAPYWVKLERGSGNAFSAYYSSNPATDPWHSMAWNPQAINMQPDVYIGIALTGHDDDPTVVGMATFSDVTTVGTVTGEWQSQDIGMRTNIAQQTYVAVEDSTGTRKAVNHEDPNATVLHTWQEWNIDLKEFTDAGVDLTSVKTMYVGVGDKDEPKPGGTGSLYIDDIRLYRPRCFLSLRSADFAKADYIEDCVVNYDELELMANDWLQGDRTASALQGHWKFEGGLNDSSGNDHDGDPCGSPTYVAGKFGQAINFAGDGDYITHGLVLPAQEGTIAHWLKPNILRRMVAYYEGSTSQNGWTAGESDILEVHSGIDDNDGQWYFCYQDGPSSTSAETITTSETAQAGVWTHIAVTWDRGGDLIIYADGVEIDRDDLTDEDFLSNAGTYHVIGGPSRRDTGRDWDGTIDDVRVYDYALSPEDVVTVMNGGTLGPHYYPLTSIANPYGPEPTNSKRIDLRDYAALADVWLEGQSWPRE
jgi:hypothetical protein